MEFIILGSGFGRKGKVSIGNTPVTVLEWGDELIRCRMKKAIASGQYDLKIVPGGSKGSRPIGAFTVRSPEIHWISDWDGTALDQITLRGRFFGTSKGKVYLEYNDEVGNVVRKNGKVLVWTMDYRNGDSEITFSVPTMTPEVCDVIVDPYGTLTEAKEEDGFTVKAPEIVSVNPSVSAIGQQATIHGRFLGTKKGKVYLNLNGTPRKKSCSVVGWTTDPATDEGDIVFVVPKGLTPGTYDLIVTNSVGSDTEPSIFSIQ